MKACNKLTTTFKLVNFVPQFVMKFKPSLLLGHSHKIYGQEVRQSSQPTTNYGIVGRESDLVRHNKHYQRHNKHYQTFDRLNNKNYKAVVRWGGPRLLSLSVKIRWLFFTLTAGFSGLWVARPESWINYYYLTRCTVRWRWRSFPQPNHDISC